jgi:Rrf2 family protein
MGMHAMAFIASASRGGPVSVSTVARELGVSEAHLGKVLQRLARHGFLSSRRGPRGGYGLGRDPEEITLLEIYEAVDGPLVESTCLLERPVCTGSTCILGDLVASVNKQLRERLSSTRLSDLGFSTRSRVRP